MSKPNQESKASLPAGMTVKAPTKDIAGQRFGMLTAIEVVGKSKANSLLWRCVCDCGNEITRASAHIRKEKGVQSCGCWLKQRNKDYLTTRVPWNKGRQYTTKADSEVYSNKAAWAKAVMRVKENKCEYCGWSLARCDVHHKVPRSAGGLNTIENALVLCPNCHRVEHEWVLA